MTDDVYLTIFVESPRRGDKPSQESVRVNTSIRTDQLIESLCKEYGLLTRHYILVRQVTGREQVLSAMNTLWQNGIYSDTTLLLRSNTTAIRNVEDGEQRLIDKGLVYLEERTTRQKFVLRWHPAVIGRAQTPRRTNLAADLTTLDERRKVSRDHACIIYKNNQYYVVGIHEKNGTYLNSNPNPLPYRRDYPLQPGDRIRVGDITLVFHLVE